MLLACTPPPKTAHVTSEAGVSRCAVAFDGVRTTMAASAATAVDLLERVPVEVLVEVFLQLDMQSAISLAGTNRRLASIFGFNRTSIVLHIARYEFSPFDGLLQVVKAMPSDLTVPWGTWLPKQVRRGNTVLCTGRPAMAQGDCVEAQIVEAQIQEADVDRLLCVLRVVRGWERIFPRLWFDSWPVLARSLTVRENERLRRALYHWMRYAFYFHGELPRPSLYVPAGPDVRMNFLRALSNRELGELEDLWSTVVDEVESMCPSVYQIGMEAEYGQHLEKEDLARIGWGERRENALVVATMSKLSPAELLYYMENQHQYTKPRLIQDIRQRHPGFECDTESLSDALSDVTHERQQHMKAMLPILLGELPEADLVAAAQYLPVYKRWMFECNGGILDWDEKPKIEALRAMLGDMVGLGVDLRPEEEYFGFSTRPEIPTGMLDP